VSYDEERQAHLNEKYKQDPRTIEPRECPKCEGAGWIGTGDGGVHTEATCDRCEGKGEI